MAWMTTREIATMWGVAVQTAHYRLTQMLKKGAARRMPLHPRKGRGSLPGVEWGSDRDSGHDPTYWDLAPSVDAGPTWLRRLSTPGTTPTPTSKTTTKARPADGPAAPATLGGDGSQ